MQDGSNRYRLQARIGQGGMAEVWRGMRRLAPGTWHTVAIKRLFGLLNSEPLALAQLEREAHICMTLHHDNLVSVYDLDMVDGRPSLIMEYVDGITLRELMDCRAVSPPMARAILRDVLAGLEHAHQRGVMHRDISPRNIMITRHGVAKVMDFGLAKNLRVDSENVGFKGTVAYASREALECALYTRGSDIYSVGAVFYEALAHSPPYGAGDRLDMVRSMEQNPRPRLPDDTPDDLRAFVEFALGPTETRTDAAVDEAIARLHASLGPVMSHDELAEGIGETLDMCMPAEAESSPVAPEHADTLDMLEHTQEPKFKPELFAALPAADAAAAEGIPAAAPGPAPRSDAHMPSPARTGRTHMRPWFSALAGAVGAVAILILVPLLDVSDHMLREQAREPTLTSDTPTSTEDLTGPRPIDRDRHATPAPAPWPNKPPRSEPTDEPDAKRRADSSRHRKVAKLRDLFAW